MPLALAAFLLLALAPARQAGAAAQVQNITVLPSGFLCPGQVITVKFEASRDASLGLNVLAALSTVPSFTTTTANTYVLHDAPAATYPPNVPMWNNPALSPGTGATAWNRVAFVAPDDVNTNFIDYSFQAVVPAYTLGSTAYLLMKVRSGGATTGVLTAGDNTYSVPIEVTCSKGYIDNVAGNGTQYSNVAQVLLISCGSPTFTATRSATPSPSLSPSATRSATPSATPSASPTRSDSPTPSPTRSHTPTLTATPSFSATPTRSDTPSATPSLTATPSRTPSPSASATPTQSQTLTETSTRTATPTETPSRTQTQTLTETPTRSVTPTETPSRTQTSTLTETSTRTATRSETPSFTHTLTLTYTFTRTHSATVTPTRTVTPTLSSTASPSATRSASPSFTPSATYTASPSVTATPSHTPTATPSATPSASPSFSATHSPSPTRSATRTASMSATPTATPSDTPPLSPTISPTFSPVPVYNARISVYNSAGELVAVLEEAMGVYVKPSGLRPLEGSFSTAQGGEAKLLLEGPDLVFSWDGSSSAGQAVASGSYQVVMELTDSFGKKEVWNAPVTVIRAEEGVLVEVFNSAGELIWMQNGGLSSPQPLGLSTREFVPGEAAGGLKISYGSGPSDYVVWDGLNSQGEAVTPGSYLVKVTQSSGSGKQSYAKQVSVIRDPREPFSAVLAGPNPLMGLGAVLELRFSGLAPGSTAWGGAYNLAGELVGSLNATAGGLGWSVPDSLAGGVYVLKVSVKSPLGIVRQATVKAVLLR